MTKEDVLKILDGAIERAREDWFDARPDISTEKDARLCMRLLGYVKDSLYQMVANK